MEEYSKTDKNKVKRVPKRGHYDKETIFKILDSAFVCHVGFVVDGQPFVIPTAYGREGEKIYLHGATKSRMMQEMEKGIPVCITVTHLDGIVMARSAFHHSMNYRSVVVFGSAKLVEESSEKNRALYIISEQIAPGRWDEARVPSDKELKATSVLAVDIETASAKIRTGNAGDDKPDYDLDIWAGVLPIQMTIGEPIEDPLLKSGIELPTSVKKYDKKRFVPEE